MGIDLGTTFSAIAYLGPNGQPRTIVSATGKETTPSVVLIRPDRSVIVGEDALAERSNTPDLVAVNFKRDMGERFYREPVGGRQFSPEALSALVLKKLARDARAVLSDVTGAVITVPAYFGDAKRKATQDAGKIAGLNVLDIINEPTAAALANAFRQYLAYGGDRTRLEIARIATRAPSTTLIFDLGGGTFDVTIIRIDSNDFEVVATGGEVRLGGVDFDQRILNYFCDEFHRRHGVDPRDTPESKEKIRARCEQAKIVLSDEMQTTISGEHLGRQLTYPITRARFDSITADLLARAQLSTEMLLEDALLTWDKIDDVLLVGGSSRMPCVAQMLEKISGKQPDMAIAPDQIVAHGAAIHAAILQMADSAAVVAADQSRRLESPAAPQEAYAQREEERMQAIFDEPVRQAAMSVKMTDVNSHALGVIVRSSREKRTVNSVIIPKNTPLPASRIKVFGTEAKNQRQVRIRVVEGDSRDPRGCTQIGECMIKSLPKGLPKGAPVEVSFKYDKSGRIHVRAVELSSRLSADVELHREYGFEQADVEKLADAVAEIDVE